jgi:RNA polymerase sigma-70 factor (family 1)
VADDQLYNEQQLLLMIANGNEAAFRQIYDGYGNRLFLYVLRLTRSKEQAEDILQNTFLKIWLRRDTLKDITDFSAYLFRMAQNSVITAIQRTALEASILQHKITPPQAETLPDEKLHSNEIRQAWLQGIQQLPPQQQKVYILQKEYGWKIQDIAEALDISPRTVKRHLADAQQALKISITMRFPRKELIVIAFFTSLHY